VSEPARKLIREECEFLGSAPRRARAVPALRASFDCARLRAMAMNYYEGDSPRPAQDGAIPELLSSWIGRRSEVPLCEMQPWARMEMKTPNSARLRFVEEVRSRRVEPVLYHGDFAPWNIKVSPGGEWMVLDWERGELAGVPGWDWFHYVIQRAILVGAEPTASLIERVDKLLASEAFQQYAQAAAVAGIEKQLVLAYLCHCIYVLQPSEGLEENRALQAGLAEHWGMR